MHNLINNLLTAVVENDGIKVNQSLRSEAYLQIRGGNRMQIFWTRPKVRHALLNEFGRWSNPKLKIEDITFNGHTAAVSFEIKASSGLRTRTFKRYALIKLFDYQVQSIILYCHDEVAKRTPQPALETIFVGQPAFAYA